MNQEDKERYKEQWSNDCFICKEKLGEERYFIESIVPINKHYDKEDKPDSYTHYYVVCPKCKEDKVLV